MTKLMRLLIIFYVAIRAVSSDEDDKQYCYATDPVKYQMSRFGKKTAYDVVRGNFDKEVSSCIPKKFWFYSRHASRLPDLGEIKNIRNIRPRVDDIINAANAGSSNLCATDFNLINKWQLDPNITDDIEQYLTVSGWNEMKGIAKRFQVAYPNLLPNFYNKSQITFRHTTRQRTKASIRSFADGIYGSFDDILPEPTPTPDLLMRPQDCPIIIDPKTYSNFERSKWMNGRQYREMITQVNEKLGLVGDERLNAKQVKTIWSICGFEQLWNISSPAPFCGAFTPENNLLLEYYEDLSSYHFFGHGRKGKLVENLNCRLMKDLLDFLMFDNGDETARVFNAHSSAFQMLMVTLGVLNEDQRLTAANFDQQSNRKWRTSVRFPMAANIAVILYE